jgi:hypothetical protein
MKWLAPAVLLVALVGCQTMPPVETNLGAFPVEAEPIPPQALLERYYQPSHAVDSSTRESVTELLVQANFRNERVRCTRLPRPPIRLSLSLQKRAAPGSVPATLLTVEYDAAEGLLMSDHEAFRIHLGATTLAPSELGGPLHAERLGGTEIRIYAVTDGDLRQIVGAESAFARLSGRAGICQMPISGHARGLIAMFLDRELPR